MGLVLYSKQEQNMGNDRDTPSISSLHDLSTLEVAKIEEEMRHFNSSVRNNVNFSRSDYGDVRAFFAEASADYDSDLENPYWSFTHDILKFILNTNIKEHFSSDQEIRVFDAGAGTGNWSKYVLSLNDRISGILFDMNSSMLRKAYPKIGQLTGNRTRIVEGNLENLNEYPSERSNLVLCMHNVIGLGRNSERIIQNIYAYLEEGGLAFLMAINKYHAYSFTSKFCGEAEVARVLRDSTVKFKADMPEMFCYTPLEFKTLISSCGFEQVTVLGYPVTIYPSPEDTKLLRKDTLDARLKNPFERERMLEIEKRLCLSPWLAHRGGSSLIAIAKKNK